MSEWKPPGWHSVTPRLVAGDPAGLVAFLRLAFGADGDYRSDRPSQLRIGDSIVMIGGAGVRERTRGFLHVYVEDADATFRRALDAGAVALEHPADMPYGDRRAMISDPYGNLWQIATYRGAP